MVTLIDTSTLHDTGAMLQKVKKGQEVAAPTCCSFNACDGSRRDYIFISTSALDCVVHVHVV